MSWADVGRGIAGDAQIQPYGILVLFMSLAYIAASLDATGLFAWLALRITALSRGRGHLLFALYYALSAAMTALTVRGWLPGWVKTLGPTRMMRMSLGSRGDENVSMACPWGG